MTTVTLENTAVKPVKTYLKRGGKSSINAKRYAELKIEKVMKGEKVIKGKIARAVGYSPRVADQATNKIENQQAYKDAMASYENKIVMLRDKTLNALANKALNEEKVYDLTALLKVADHSAKLTRGESTENIQTKAAIVVFGSDDFLSMQIERNKGDIQNKNVA